MLCAKLSTSKEGCKGKMIMMAKRNSFLMLIKL